MWESNHYLMKSRKNVGSVSHVLNIHAAFQSCSKQNAQITRMFKSNKNSSCFQSYNPSVIIFNHVL